MADIEAMRAIANEALIEARATPEALAFRIAQEATLAVHKDLERAQEHENAAASAWRETPQWKAYDHAFRNVIDAKNHPRRVRARPSNGAEPE